MSYLDTAINPLLESLLELADERGGLTIVEVEGFLADAARNEANFLRVGADGVPKATNVVALYTRRIDIGGQDVQAGNIAKDLSLRSADIVALDTTNYGRLLIDLSALADERVSDADGVLARLFGSPDYDVHLRTDLGSVITNTFSTASENLVRFNQGQIIAVVGEGADPAGIMSRIELPAALDSGRYTHIQGISVDEFKVGLDETIGYGQGDNPARILAKAGIAWGDALRELDGPLFLGQPDERGYVTEASTEYNNAFKQKLGLDAVTLAPRDAVYAPGTFGAGQFDGLKKLGADIYAKSKSILTQIYASAETFTVEKLSAMWAGLDDLTNRMADELSRLVQKISGSIDLTRDTLTSAYEKLLQAAQDGTGRIAATYDEILQSGQRWLKAFLDTGIDAFDRISPGLASAWQSVRDYYGRAWDLTLDGFRYDGNAVSYAAKLGGSVLALGLGALETAVVWKKHGGFTPEFFAEITLKVAIAATLLPIAASAAGAVMSIAPVWGTVAVVGLVAAGTYAAVRILADEIVEVWGETAEDRDSFIYKAALEVKEFLDRVESAVVSYVDDALAATAGLASALVAGASAGLSSFKLNEIATVAGDAAAFTDDREGVWLWGEDNAALIGGTASDWLFHSGYGDVFGGEGDDALFGIFPKTLKAGQPIGPAPAAGEGDTRRIADRDLSLTLDGGAGNDWLVVIGGEKAVTIGGNGRDWIFNTSKNGVLYGDTIDGRSPDGTDLGGRENSDNFWWWPSTTIMDAKPNDVLKFFGFPLTGGTNNIPFMVSAALGLGAWSSAPGLVLAKSPLYFDNILVFMNYVKVGDDLYVVNMFDGLAAVFGNFEFGTAATVDESGSPTEVDIRGAMRVVDYDDATSAWGVAILNATVRDIAAGGGTLGDLGMVFKNANPALAILQILPLPGGLGALGKLLGLVDEVTNLAAAALRFAKSLAWAAGVDPLVLDLDGDGIETLDFDDADTRVYFDDDGDFFRERTGWLDGDDGFLALDLNGNGVVDDISELFGGVGERGFAALSEHDENADGVIDARDGVFARLLVWQDRDSDGVSEADEVTSLADHGIVSIDYGSAVDIGVTTPQGVQLLAESRFTRADGSTGDVLEAIFERDDVDTVYRGESGLSPWLAGLGIDAKGFGRVTDLSVAMSNDFDLGAVTAATAAAMTTPKLKTLVQQAGEALGAWGWSLDLTRELTPVLLETDAAGTVTLLDRGVWVEDAQGGYWTLASGAAVLDAGGAAIARPGIEDVLAQATAAGSGWRLEQVWSPATRETPLAHREAAPYLAEIVDGRVVVHDFGIENPDGSWRLASGAPVLDANGVAIAAPTREDVLAMAAPAGREWRIESLGYNPFASIPVERIGVYMVDGIAVDYTVEVTDRDGTFYVWARNLDRALELQHKVGTAREFALRNFEVDFDTLDEVGSTDDSTFRVEMFTPAQFHFALSLGGLDFRPEMLSAAIDEATGVIAYSVNESGEPSLSPDGYVSGIKAVIDLLDVVVDQYIMVSRAFAARLALQGGLSSYAPGIAYDIEADAWRPTTDRGLMPVFEAIFAGAPAGFEPAYAWLQDWNEILEQVYSDYIPDTSVNPLGNAVPIDQAFLFQQMLPAFETVGIDVDLAAAMNALGIDETLLREHAPDSTAVSGTSGTDFFYMTGGDQTYTGGFGSDYYFVSGVSGADLIDDKDVGGGHDELRFIDVTPDQVTAERDGQDLILTIAGRPDTIRLIDQFLGELNDYTLKGEQFTSGVDAIVFANGAIWDRFRMALEVADPRVTNDVYIGSGEADVLWGGPGNDALRGMVGGDIYVYARGDGQDVIHDTGGFSFGPIQAGVDFLKFRGDDITSDDLKLVRDGPSDDLLIILLDENGQETTDTILIKGQFGGVRLNLGAFAAIDPSFAEADYIAPDLIERFIFTDGTSIDFEEIVERVLENARTDGDDAIYGLLNANTLDGGAGDDYLTGREGGDTYVFGRGYGRDVVEDDDFSLKIFGADPDRLRFVDDLRWTDFDFLREGPSDTLTMRVSGTLDEVVLVDMLEVYPFVGYVNLIEDIEYGDGTVWSWLKLLQHYIDIAKTPGDDVIYGFSIADTLDGGAGDDRLEGLGGNDTYLFARGYGTDTILDASGDDRVLLQGILTTEVTFSRTALDLIITVDDTGDRIVLENQYVRADRQTYAVEYLDFADRSLLFTNLNPEDIDLVGTSAGETITGSDFAETLDGRAGDDTLIGGDGGDRYKFDVGYGQDVIVDARARAAWQDRPGTVVPVDDVVVFGADITRANVVFSKDALDLLVTVTGRTDTLRIKNQFRDVTDGVERFEFADGTWLSNADVEAILQIEGGNRGDNIIEGSATQPSTLDGRQGDDTLIGGTAGDTYAFGAEYDFDRIVETTDQAGVVDRVVFGATVSYDALVLRRDGDDLLIDLGDGADVLTIVGGLATTRVEEFHFADGTVVTLETLLDRLLAGTDGDDRIVGFDGRADVIAGGAGSDALEGGAGDDVYRFGFGDGSDSISETGGVDRIEFGAGVTRDAVRFREIDGDLLITLAATGDRLVVLGGGGASNSAANVESYVFADGETLTRAEVLAQIRREASNTGQDYIDATVLDPSLVVRPGIGFDTVRMGGDTTVVIERGGGVDRIELPSPGQVRTAEIVFDGFASTEAVVRAAGPTSPDLIVSFPETGDQVLLVRALDYTVTPRIVFSDGVSWDNAALVARSIADQAGAEADYILGSDRADTISGGRGDDELRGEQGDDTYLFTRGDGRDVIVDSSGTDTLRITGYLPSDVTIVRPVPDRNDIVLRFAGTDDEIVLVDQFGTATGRGVERVVFGDGTQWDRAFLVSAVLTVGTDADDQLEGTSGSETLVGGRGDDILRGLDGSDTYVFARGDGVDIIDESGLRDTDVLRFVGYAPEEVLLLRPRDASNDLLIRFTTSDDEIRIVGGLFGGDRDEIEEFRFEDGTLWTLAAVRNRVFLEQMTSGDDVVLGIAVAETLEGGRGPP